MFLVLSFLVLDLVLAACLGAAGFGVYALAFAVLQLAALLLVPEAGKTKDKKSFFSCALLVLMGLGILAAVVLAVSGEVLAARVFHMPELRFPLGLCAFALPLEVQIRMMDAFGAGYKKFSAGRVRAVLVLAGVLGLMAQGSFGAETVLTVYLVGSVFAFLYGLFAASHHKMIPDLKQIDWTVARAVLKSLRPKRAVVLSGSALIIALGLFLSPVSLGAAVLGLRLGLGLVLLMTAVTKTTRGFLALGLAALLLFAGDAGYLLQGLGAGYRDAWLFAVVFTAAGFLTAVFKRGAGGAQSSFFIVWAAALACLAGYSVNKLIASAGFLHFLKVGAASLAVYGIALAFIVLYAPRKAIR